jgi:hypothetical protein
MLMNGVTPAGSLPRQHCRCSSMAEHQLPKLNTRVRFPSSAPYSAGQIGGAGSDEGGLLLRSRSPDRPLPGRMNPVQFWPWIQTSAAFFFRRWPRGATTSDRPTPSQGRCSVTPTRRVCVCDGWRISRAASSPIPLLLRSSPRTGSCAAVRLGSDSAACLIPIALCDTRFTVRMAVVSVECNVHASCGLVSRCLRARSVLLPRRTEDHQWPRPP